MQTPHRSSADALGSKRKKIDKEEQNIKKKKKMLYPMVVFEGVICYRIIVCPLTFASERCEVRTTLKRWVSLGDTCIQIRGTNADDAWYKKKKTHLFYH